MYRQAKYETSPGRLGRDGSIRVRVHPERKNKNRHVIALMAKIEGRAFRQSCARDKNIHPESSSTMTQENRSVSQTSGDARTPLTDDICAAFACHWIPCAINAARPFSIRKCAKPKHIARVDGITTKAIAANPHQSAKRRRNLRSSPKTCRTWISATGSDPNVSATPTAGL